MTDAVQRAVPLDALRAQCDTVGMALEIEILAMTDNNGASLVQTSVSEIAPLVRQAMELGAGIIKADPTAPSEDFAEVVAATAGIPLLEREGIKASDVEILKRTEDLMRAGARGIADGRNVMWVKQPRVMTCALIQIIHGGTSASEAMVNCGIEVVSMRRRAPGVTAVPRPISRHLIRRQHCAARCSSRSPSSQGRLARIA